MTVTSAGDLAWATAARLLRDHVVHQARWLVVGGIFMSLYAAATAAQAWLMEPMLDQVFLERNQTMLMLVPVAIVGLALVKGISSYCQVVAVNRVGHRVIADLRGRLFDHLIRTDLGYLQMRGPGPLISGLIYDTQQLRMAVSSALTTVVRDALTLVLLIGLMFHQDWKLACIAVLGFPTAAIPIISLGRRMRRIGGRVQAQVADLTARFEQIFQGVRQVKADNREAHEAARTADMLERLYALNYKASRISAISSPTMEVIGGLAVAVVIGYGGWQVLAGTTTPGTFFSFVTALMFAYRPLKTLANLHAQVQVGLAAADRVYAILDREPVIRDLPTAGSLPPGPRSIQFDRVWFGYRPDQPTIAGLDLMIPAGATVALVGPSGAGKSTMLNLILRFYDVDRGAIRIDGHDVREISLAGLRNELGLVSQDVDLFDDTVAANIGYGRPDATAVEIVAAATAAAAHDFVSALPNGYDTMIGPGGISLSGGERQRLGIARAMLKNPPILLLDEATSSLDSDAERVVQLALGRLMRGRTTVVIAHRLATVVNADVIAMIDAGQVVETGNHQALLARDGHYARLYHQQFATQLTVPGTTPLDSPVAAVGGGRR